MVDAAAGCCCGDAGGWMVVGGWMDGWMVVVGGWCQMGVPISQTHLSRFSRLWIKAGEGGARSSSSSPGGGGGVGGGGGGGGGGGSHPAYDTPEAVSEQPYPLYLCGKARSAHTPHLTGLR